MAHLGVVGDDLGQGLKELRLLQLWLLIQVVQVYQHCQLGVSRKEVRLQRR